MLTYNFTIQYKKGINMLADFLSRSKIDKIYAIDPFCPSLAHEQALDPDLVTLRQFHQTSSWPAGTSKLDKARILRLLQKILVRDVLILIKLSDHEHQHIVLYLPPKFRKRAMCEALSSLLSGHDAVTKTYIIITDSYTWTGIKADIKAPNQRVHVDLFGPLKISEKSNKYILCMTVWFTKYAEVVAIPDKTALTVSNEIFINWICRFGTQIQINSDRVKEFYNKLADKIYELLDIKHTKTSPAHPQCNSQVEVFATVAKYLASFVDNSTLDWEQYLLTLMLSYNTSYHSTIMTTPFELLYSVKARFPSFPNPGI